MSAPCLTQNARNIDARLEISTVNGDWGPAGHNYRWAMQAKLGNAIIGNFLRLKASLIGQYIEVY